MKIQVRDIGIEGKEVNFSLELNNLNKRTNEVRKETKGKALPPPEYIFTKTPKVELNLKLENTTVVLSGKTSTAFKTPCSRCAEEIETELSSKIQMILKPYSERDREEDIGLGFYDGQEVDCKEIVEEHLMLSIPYKVCCSELETCNSESLKYEDNKEEKQTPFEILKSLKI